jgi:hypothetical protein
MSLINELIKDLLPKDKQREVAVYGGGFKPPTKGHFEVVKTALDRNPNIDKFIILIGGKERDGISPDESLLIWDIYKKYLPIKVEIQLSPKPPIQAVYNYAKNNPEELVLFIIGAREGNEDDFKDIASRTTSLDKYPNLDLRTIITQGGVSGTAARNAAKISLEKFKPFVPSELSDEEVEEVYNIVSNKVQEVLTENASYSNEINIKNEIAKLTKHMIDKGMNILPLPQLIFKHGDVDNATKFLGKTAYYDPNTKAIVLYTEGRHPKDIVRSFAHEMIHHIQNLEGRLGNISTTNTHEDDNLNDIEAEANLKGTMTFRNFTDSLQEKKNKDPFGLNAYAMELGRLREEKTEYKIYVDMDGVVADFDQRFIDLSGMLPREFEAKYGKDAFWDFIDEGKNKLKFWVGIPPMSDAKQLIDYVSKYNYEMLTAPSTKKQSLMGKGLWMINQTKNGLFPFKPKINYKSAKNKKDFAAPNHILIDDREDTINSWNAAGGIGILHTSAANTISQLKKLSL